MIPAIFWTSITVLAYVLGLSLQRASGQHPVANPVLIAIAIVGALLVATGTDYADYFRATWLLTLLLGPATVALGVPLARHAALVRANARAVLLAVSVGAVVSMLTAVAVAHALGASGSTTLSLLPKAATTPIAMGAAETIGGLPSLSAVFAILGGIVAAMSLETLFRLIGVRQAAAIGLAAGTAGSGIASAHVARMGSQFAAFAAIGLGLSGLLTALLAPLVAQLLP